MRTPGALRRRARDRDTYRQRVTLTAAVLVALDGWNREKPKESGFAPTSGYATVERAYHPRDRHRPIIGFSPNGMEA
jgi:hypothetical protein